MQYLLLVIFFVPVCVCAETMSCLAKDEKVLEVPMRLEPDFTRYGWEPRSCNETFGTASLRLHVIPFPSVSVDGTVVTSYQYLLYQGGGPPVAAFAGDDWLIELLKKLDTVKP